MTFPAAIRTCFQKYVTFSGRAPRPEFWYFILFLLFGSIVAVVINSAIFGPTLTYRFNVDDAGQPIGEPIAVGYRYHGGWIGTVFMLATLLPWLAVTWRRMHDSGRPGYLPFLTVFAWIGCVFGYLLFQLGPSDFAADFAVDGQVTTQTAPAVGLLFFAGWLAALILNIVWLTRKSTPGPNKFGPNPSEVIP
ncbi:MAG: DUF805 domain-containing protein [Pseudomonadota bacterium]